MEVSEQEVTELVLTLDTIYRSLEDKKFFLGLTGDSLSYTAVKIAVSKARMIDVKRLAEIDAKDAETEYKRVKAVAMRRLVGTQTSDDGPKISLSAAEKLIYGEDDVIAASQSQTQKEATFNRLKSLVADGHDVIEAIRSRLIDLQGSRKDEGI